MPAFQLDTVTAEDAALGRLAVKGYEVGSTNWRNIGSLLVNGWTAAGGANILLLRRDGNIVTMFARGLVGAGTSTTFIDALPLGFQPRQTTGFPYYNTAITATSIGGGMAVVSGAVLQSGSSSATMNFSFSWPTQNAWPTALPGTAA